MVSAFGLSLLLGGLFFWVLLSGFWNLGNLCVFLKHSVICVGFAACCYFNHFKETVKLEIFFKGTQGKSRFINCM